MGTKNQPGIYDCLAKAEDDEPYFVLLGRDSSAPALITAWVNQRRHKIRVGLVPNTPAEHAQIAEAGELAKAMLEFQAKRKAAQQAAQQPRKGSR